MGNIVLSAFSDEYAVPFEEQLAAMAGFGIGHIELRQADGKNVAALTAQEVKEIRKKLEYYGISVSAIGSPFGKIPLDGDMEGHMDTLRKLLTTANELGAKYLRMFSFYAPKGKKITDCRGEVFEALERAVVVAREYGVTLCHENEALIYGDIPERCFEIADRFGGELKVVFDMGNYVLEGVDPLTAYALLREHIAYFHIKDALAAGAIVPPGRGEAKIAEILADHKAYSKDDFFVSLEPHLQLFSGLNSLVGRSFDNPYKYEDTQSAFSDAVIKLRELL